VVENVAQVGESGGEPVRARRRRARLAGGRERRFYVKASDAEAERLLELAAGAGVSVPRLLVESTLAGGRGSVGERAAVLAELVALSRALGRVGVNVNQIARATNATGEMHEQTVDTLAVVREVGERIAATLAVLDPAGTGRVAG
jgi:hypothetical protein